MEKYRTSDVHFSRLTSVFDYINALDSWKYLLRSYTDENGKFGKLETNILANNWSSWWADYMLERGVYKWNLGILIRQKILEDFLFWSSLGIFLYK
jgi:hypothetical protein